MEIPGQEQKDKNSNVLIHIVKKTVKINNKDHILIFLRDVTFGVLYEQIKAKDSLKRMIN